MLPLWVFNSQERKTTKSSSCWVISLPVGQGHIILLAAPSGININVFLCLILFCFSKVQRHCLPMFNVFCWAFFATSVCLLAFALQWPIIMEGYGTRDWDWDCANCYSPHAIEAIVGSINGQHRGACVRLGHAAIPLEDDHFGPDLVVDLGPFVQHFLNVFLRDTK